MLSASASLVFNKNICTQNNAKLYIHTPTTSADAFVSQQYVQKRNGVLLRLR
jgi:hypothetical protein